MSRPADGERKHGLAVTQQRARASAAGPCGCHSGERTGRLCACQAAEVGRTHFTGEDRAGQQPVGLWDSPVTTELAGLS